MSNQLEQFIKDHRDEFDSEEPVRKVWEQVVPAAPVTATETRVVRLRVIRWAVAAAVIGLLAGGLWFFNRPAPKASNNLPEAPVVANTEKPAIDSTSNKSTAAVPTDTASAIVKQQTKPAETPVTDPSEAEDRASEIAHFAGLVEIKHRQLKKIEKDEPLLYKQFAGDVNKLDSVYNTLKKQLPKNPNREQLLEAMIQNLQLQMGLLNHQLEIIKQINHSKKSAYEKAYKSV